MDIVRENADLLVVTEGFGKRTPISDTAPKTGAVGSQTTGPASAMVKLPA